MKIYNLVVRDDNGSVIHVDSWGIVALEHNNKSEAEALKVLANRLKQKARLVEKSSVNRD